MALFFFFFFVAIFLSLVFTSVVDDENTISPSKEEQKNYLADYKFVLPGRVHCGDQMILTTSGLVSYDPCRDHFALLSPWSEISHTLSHMSAVIQRQGGFASAIERVTSLIESDEVMPSLIDMPWISMHWQVTRDGKFGARVFVNKQRLLFGDSSVCLIKWADNRSSSEFKGKKCRHVLAQNVKSIQITSDKMLVFLQKDRGVIDDSLVPKVRLSSLSMGEYLKPSSEWSINLLFDIVKYLMMAIWSDDWLLARTERMRQRTMAEAYISRIRQAKQRQGREERENKVVVSPINHEKDVNEKDFLSQEDKDGDCSRDVDKALEVDTTTVTKNNRVVILDWSKDGMVYWEHRANDIEGAMLDHYHGRYVALLHAEGNTVSVHDTLGNKVVDGKKNPPIKLFGTLKGKFCRLEKLFLVIDSKQKETDNDGKTVISTTTTTDGMQQVVPSFFLNYSTCQDTSGADRSQWLTDGENHHWPIDGHFISIVDGSDSTKILIYSRNNRIYSKGFCESAVEKLLFPPSNDDSKSDWLVSEDLRSVLQIFQEDRDRLVKPEPGVKSFRFFIKNE